MKHNIYAGIFGMAVADALWVGGTHFAWYWVIPLGLASGVVYAEISKLWGKLWKK